MRKTIKRTAVVGLTLGATLTVGVAFAFWTTTGSGTGVANVGTDAGTDKIKIEQTAAHVTGLSGYYPGAAAKDVNVMVSNPAAFAQKVGNITVTVGDTTGCVAADNWEVVDVAETNSVLTPNDSAAGGTDEVASVKVATLRLKETGVNQDGCKTDAPVLTFASAPNAS